MKKRYAKIIAAVTASAMIACTMPEYPCRLPAAPAITAYADGGFLYEKNYSGICITGYTGTDKTVTIPEEIDGKTVTRIGKSAFENNTGITSVILPDTLETIEEYAFRGCSGLTSITLPEGLKSLDEEVFAGTGITEVILPASLGICDYAFKGCTTLRKATFAEGTEEVSPCILGYAPSLETVVFPDTVTYIGQSAFRGCTSLSEITLPPALEQMGGYAFSGTSLKELTLPASLVESKSENGPFEDCDRLRKVTFEDGMETIPARILKGAHCLSEVAVPDSVTGVGESAFENCVSLKEFPFREGLTYLGPCAFAGTAITELVFPLSLAENVSKSKSAFAGCDTLRKVTFADGIEDIPIDCMSGTRGLREAVIPESVTVICDRAFSGSGIRHIDLHEGIVQIAMDAFSNSALTEVTLPTTLTEARLAFRNSNNLKKVVFKEGADRVLDSCLADCKSVEEVVLPDTIKTIEYEAFKGTSSLKSITLPESLETIRINAFEESGITDIVIPDSVTDLSTGAFADCKDLRTATLGSGEILIGSVFNDCTSLKKVTIPETGVMAIGRNAFSGCSALDEIEYSGDPLIIEENSFNGCYALQDERYDCLVHPVSGLTPAVNSTVTGNRAEFTVSFEVPEDLGTEGTLHELVLNIPRGTNLITESMTVDSGTLSSKSDPDNLRSYIYFTSRSGSVTFSVESDSADNISISADLKVKINGASTTLPVGIASLTVDDLVLRVPAKTGSLRNTISGQGPRGKKVDILMDGNVIASPDCDPANGAFSFEATLPEGTASGSSFMLSARYDETTTEEAALVYNPDTPVIKSVKMHTADPDSDIDLTPSFTDGTIHFVPLLSSSDVRFTLDITDPEEVSKAAVIYTRDGTSPEIYEATYDSESGFWIADCDMGSYSYGNVYGINVAVLTREDEAAGKKIDAKNCCYSSPAGLRLYTYTSGASYEGAPSNRIPYAEFTLYKVNKDGTRTLWETDEYIQNNPFIGDGNGYFAWGLPENGSWNIVCRAEGYEPAESGVFYVGDSYLNLRKYIGFVSYDPGEVTDVVYDKEKNCLVMTFSKYMIPSTVSSDIVSAEGVEGFWIEPSFHAKDEDVTDTYLIHGYFTEGDKVNVNVGTGCLSYAEVENTKEFSKTVTIGEDIPSETVTTTTNAGPSSVSTSTEAAPSGTTVPVSTEAATETAPVTSSLPAASTETGPVSTSETVPATSTESAAVTTALRPATIAVLPATTTAVPAATTAIPSTTTVIPATTTVIPTTATAEPTTASAKPATTAVPATTTVPVTTTPAEPPVPEGTPGDVNGDGLIDSSDASEVLLEYANVATGHEPVLSKYVADVNGDGRVDSSDASLILAYYAQISVGGDISFEEFIRENT